VAQFTFASIPEVPKHTPLLVKSMIETILSVMEEPNKNRGYETSSAAYTDLRCSQALLLLVGHVREEQAAMELFQRLITFLMGQSILVHVRLLLEWCTVLLAMKFPDGTVPRLIGYV
jgi:hypothetical protein